MDNLDLRNSSDARHDCNQLTRHSIPSQSLTIKIFDRFVYARLRKNGEALKT